MRALIISFLPRRLLQRALFLQWRRTLNRTERIRLDYWGTAGSDRGDHPFQWADEIKPDGDGN